MRLRLGFIKIQQICNNVFTVPLFCLLISRHISIGAREPRLHASRLSPLSGVPAYDSAKDFPLNDRAKQERGVGSEISNDYNKFLSPLRFDCQPHLIGLGCSSFSTPSSCSYAFVSRVSNAS